MHLLFLAACDGGKPTTEDDTVAHDGDATLELALDAEASVAGEPVGYQLQAVWSDGTREDVDGTIGSDLEPGLDAGGGSLTATVAGDHALTATAEVAGLELTDSAALEVTAGATAVVDLVLAADTAGPGEEVGYTVTAADAYGNATDASDYAIDTEVAMDADISDTTISSTLAGLWSVGAEVDGVYDAETLTILPGDAASVELTVSPMDPDPGDTSVATVVVSDAWGNTVDASWTLTVDGGLATIDADEITFEEEGAYTVWVDAGGLTDSVGPIWVDETGPTLLVESPGRGSWVDTGALAVTGTATDAVSGVASVTVNGIEATLGFSGELTCDFGMEVIETVATDGDGNVSDDVRAVLAGDVLPWGDPEDDGIVVRMHEGEGGLDELTTGFEDALDPDVILASLPSPLYDEEGEECYTVWGYTYCTDYALSIEITSLGWASADLELDPQADGTLLATVTLTDIEADWSAEGEASGEEYSDTGTATADSLVVEASVVLSVENGAIAAEVGDVEATLTNLDLGLPSWADTILSYFGYDLAAAFEDDLEAALEDELAASLPELLEDAFASLVSSEEVAIGEATATVNTELGAVTTDDTGITLSLATVVSLDTWILGREAEGSLAYGYAVPTWTGSPGALVGLSADFLAQLLYASWGGGALSMETTDEELGVDMTTIGLVLPGLSDLTLVTDPLLPPVAVAGTTAMFDLQVGDLLLTMYDGERVEGAEVYQFYVTMVTPMDLEVDGDEIVTVLGTPTAWIDVVTAPEDADVEALEDLLEAFAPSLLSSVTSLDVAIPIPSLGEATLVSPAVGVGGAESGYAVVEGDLEG